MRKRRRNIFLLVTSLCGLGHAQETDGVDLNALSAPSQPSAFVAIEPGHGPEDGKFNWGLRSSFLSEPLAVRLPSPDPGGSDAGVVSGAVLTEFTAGIGLGQGFDVGAAFGAHVYQWGPGGETTSGSSSDLPSFGARDPRFSLAWTHAFKTSALRPFFHLLIPLGRANAFAGERSMRVEGGLAFSTKQGRWEWGSQASFVYRQKVELSASTWGPQIHAATGLTFDILEILDAGAEIHVLPVLSSQQSFAGDSGGALIPAEVLASLGLNVKAWTIRLAGGTGLPLSQTSSVHPDSEWVRGPTSPLFRGLLDFRLTL